MNLKACSSAICCLTLAMASHAHDGAGGDLTPPDTAAITQAVVMGAGTHRFESVPLWCQLPPGGDAVSLGATHGGIVVDKAGLIYFSTDTDRSIMVYEPGGKFLRSFDKSYAGTHALAIHEENGEEFIYAAHLRGNQVVKFKLDGTPVLTLPWPEASGKYAQASEYKVTGVAVAANGDIYAADGYGKKWIHRYSREGRLLATFGGPDADPSSPTIEGLSNPHGIALDMRHDRPLLLVADREKKRLVHFDLEGSFVGVVAENLRRPCSLSVQGDHVAVAELQGRVTILDKSGEVVTHLGDNPNQGEWANFKVASTDWKDGIFTAPHGISFDRSGNLLVMDWNASGRVSFLKRL